MMNLNWVDGLPKSSSWKSRIAILSNLAPITFREPKPRVYKGIHDILDQHDFYQNDFAWIAHLRPMAESSFAWAKEKGLIRKNVVHGEEEARLVLRDEFSYSKQSGNEMSASGSFQVEDPNFSLLNQVDFQSSGFEGDGTVHEASTQKEAPAASGSFRFLSNNWG